MQKTLLLLAAAALPAIAAPAMAQTYQEQQRWDMAQRRYDAETRLFQQARQAYFAARARDHRDGYRDDRYGNVPPPPPPGYGNDGPPPPPGAYAGAPTDYDAYRDYRDEPGYERRMTSADQVYRGSDGRYYCKRTDGTTGLIVGGASGALLGNVIDGGRHRATGTLIGGALGALLGKSVEQQNNDYRCR
jgi:hypothetical protein